MTTRSVSLRLLLVGVLAVSVLGVGCRRAGPDIRIDVLDTGSGIAEEAMPKIFDAFTRLDHERCDGLGIGLFIVRQALPPALL